MPRPFPSLAPLLIASLLLARCGWADTKPIAPIVAATGPRSVFIDQPDFGKDPFFPRSSRRPKVIVRTTDLEPPRAVVPDAIVLKGISVLKERKLAIINYYTAAEGEEFSLKFNGQVVKVKCVEIKDRSAVISVNGATKEIPLREGF